MVTDLSTPTEGKPGNRNNFENEKSLRRGHAVALQYVALLLKRIADGAITLDRSALNRMTTVAGVDGGHVLALGCQAVHPFVLAFALELGLKALLTQRTGAHLRTHDLLKLFKRLPEDVQGEAGRAFEKTLRRCGEKNSVDLLGLLQQHRDDFEGWRYFEKTTPARGTSDDLLHYALCALLDVYEDYDAGND